MSITDPKNSSGRPGLSRRWKFVAVCGCVVVTIVALGYFMVRWQVRSSATDTLREAERHLRNRDNAAVREALSWLLWFEPTNHRALLIFGVSLNADRRFSEAVETLERIPDNSASEQERGIALASSLIHDGSLDRAEIVLRQHLGRYPDSAEAREQLVRLYVREFRKRDATTLLMDHLSRYPDDLSVLPHLLELEAKIVLPQDRVESLETADISHPDQHPVVLALARAYALMGQTERARKRFQAALTLKPDHPDTRILAAEFHLDCGDRQTAQDLLGSDALNDDRDWFIRCRIEQQSGNVENAYAHLQQALALRPNDETYLLMQAGLLRRLGRLDEAVAAAREATRLAQDRERLMILSDEIDRFRPASTHCLEIAELLDRLGRPKLAADWRRVGKAVADNDAARGRLPGSTGRTP